MDIQNWVSAPIGWEYNAVILKLGARHAGTDTLDARGSKVSFAGS